MESVWGTTTELVRHFVADRIHSRAPTLSRLSRIRPGLMQCVEKVAKDNFGAYVAELYYTPSSTPSVVLRNKRLKQLCH